MAKTIRHAAWWAACGWLAIVMSGCGTTVQGGLASAPNANRTWTENDMGQEPISNGDRSCMIEPGKPDPLPNRFPPCAEATAVRPIQHRGPAASARLGAHLRSSATK